MAKIIKNERSWAISLITDINLMVSKKTWIIKRAGGETTINTGKKRMFPDVILYGDISQTQILQGWEIKMPDVLITDETFIKDAQRKADILGLDSCFIWNFTYGVLYIKDDKGGFKIERVWDETKYIKTREDVETYKKEWLLLIESILFDINSYFVSGKFHSAGLGEIISDTVMLSIINRNKSLVADELRRKAITDAKMRSYFSVWWDEVKAEYLSDENNMYEAYAKTILLSWVNKFLFSHMIKKYHNPAYAVEKIDYKSSPNDAIKVFEDITKKCDFFNIFQNIEYSEFMPKDTWDDFIEFNMFLNSNDIANIEHNALQAILENTVKSSKRAIIGQYTTPQKLAEILVRLTVNDLNGLCIDPCCGTGTIAKAILNYKKQSISINDSYCTTWASDKYSFPLQISNISLTNADAINIPCRIFQSDVFDLKVGKAVSITNPSNGVIMSLDLPEFDAVISNLPFINFNKEKEEKDVSIQKIIKEIEDNTGIKTIRRNDLYTYIIIALWKVIKNQGKLGVITSNSWLGTEAGKQFFDIVRWYYNVNGIYISGTGKWFHNADVMATIIIMSKKEISAPSNETNIQFGIINKTLEQLEDDKLLLDLVNSAILSKEINKDVLKLKTYDTLTIDNLRSMNICINALFHDVSWLLDIKENLCELNSLFKVYRGEKTGQDEIFYLKDASVVNAEYLRKGLKNTHNCKRLIATPDTDVFCCYNSIEDMKRLNHNKTLAWIKKFKSNLNKSLIVKKDKWYILDTNKLAYLFTGMNPEERIFFGRFEEPAFINQRLIGLIPLDKSVDIDLCHALLNSMLEMFYIEAIGFGRGLGALDFSKDNLENIFMYNPKILDGTKRDNIIKAFKPLLNRDILTTEEELKQEDRINFEHTVLEAYGIDNYYSNIRASLLSIQSVRLSAESSK